MNTAYKLLGNIRFSYNLYLPPNTILLDIALLNMSRVCSLASVTFAQQPNRPHYVDFGFYCSIWALWAIPLR